MKHYCNTCTFNWGFCRVRLQGYSGFSSNPNQIHCILKPIYYPIYTIFLYYVSLSSKTARKHKNKKYDGPICYPSATIHIGWVFTIASTYAYDMDVWRMFLSSHLQPKRLKRFETNEVFESAAIGSPHVLRKYVISHSSISQRRLAHIDS